MDSVIHTEKITKLFGEVEAVVDVDLDVRPGEIFGYLGPNGAGKSTTIRMLLDHIRPTRGTGTVFGLDIRRDSVEIRRNIGYLPGEFTLYDHMTGRAMLQYFANLRGGVEWQYVRELTTRLDVDLDRRYSQLSRGNKQKVGLLQAMMHKPKLVILDEPTSGLDPLIQHEFYEILDEVKAEGRTVFFSSHVLPEVQRVSDRVGIIRRGRLVAVEDVDTLIDRAALHRFEIEFASKVSRSEFEHLEGASDLALDGRTVTVSIAGSPDALIKAAARHEIVRLVTHEASLDDIFLTFYSEDGEGGDAG